jgi:hypothetical protein
MTQKNCPFGLHSSVVSLAEKYNFSKQPKISFEVSPSKKRPFESMRTADNPVSKGYIEKELEKSKRLRINNRNKIPLQLLYEIANLLQIDGYRRFDEQQITCLIEKDLGPDQLSWGNKIQTIHKNEDLGIRVYRCFKPILPTSMIHLHSNSIYDGIKHVLQSSENEGDDLSFELYFPCEAGKLFTEKDIKIKNQHGFIINTGKILNGGSHWVFLFIDTVECSVEYIDSLGAKPNEDVNLTVNSIRNAIKQTFPWSNIGNKVRFVSTRKQSGSTECGMFILTFTLLRISGKSLLEIAQMKITDVDCFRLRSYFFNIQASV